MRKLNKKKILKSPIAVIVLLVFIWPFLWAASTGIAMASYSLGLSNHLGASVGYFNSNKISNFVSLPFDRINLSAGYGFQRFWVSEGSEIYVRYSAENYGSKRMGFMIGDYDILSGGEEFEYVEIEKSGSGIHRYRAKTSGFYKVGVFPPKRLVPAGDDVRYRYTMRWGVKR